MALGLAPRYQMTKPFPNRCLPTGQAGKHRNIKPTGGTKKSFTHITKSHINKAFNRILNTKKSTTPRQAHEVFQITKFFLIDASIGVLNPLVGIII